MTTERTAQEWDIEAVDPPWGPSLYDHIIEHSTVEGGLTEQGQQLPDEADDGEVKFAPGARDGIVLNHVAHHSDDERTAQLFQALKEVLHAVTPATLGAFYDLSHSDSALASVDGLLTAIVSDQELRVARLERLAVWLVHNAAHREALKTAIALVGILPTEQHTDVLMDVGLHDEFTLYVGVALQNTLEDPEPRLYELARTVDGWGRIHLVRFLRDTERPAIKAWMLREGYRNRVLHEYTAYTCATTGGLAEALEAEALDEPLLRGASEIIAALITGGPAADMDDYEPGARVVERYLHHLGAQPQHPQTLTLIEGFLAEDDADWSARADRGWTPKLRAELRARCATLRGQMG